MAIVTKADIKRTTAI